MEERDGNKGQIISLHNQEVVGEHGGVVGPGQGNGGGGDLVALL